MQRSHDTLASSISAENWCLETVLPLPFPCIVDLANYGGPCDVVTLVHTGKASYVHIKAMSSILV